ncbi:YceI family protein [Kaistella jeonii]|uniref:Lipid/polyisoprenoid-binding YceI-like domain-containing protein n=1 Tax=Kaistella jeonii TaxID=266749 RepID=A0A0C1FA12_9FLAO|nr:YceI family protein [Kaistella jeonii]KIA88733.1 hypothetical protein OA86_09805 [Kaistella jeonii]
MKKLLPFIFLFFTIILFAQTKNVTSSEIRWKGYKTLKAEALSHNGTLKLKSGNLLVKGSEIAGGNFVMDMTSMDSEDLNGNPKLKKMFENHLKSDDFFDAAKYPVSTYQIKSVRKLNGGVFNYQINGVLTIKGISKNVNFPAKVSQINDEIKLTSARFTFNRKSFGLNYNIFEDMLISNDVEMNISIVAK